jgi:hypothetical protein
MNGPQRLGIIVSRPVDLTDWSIADDDSQTLFHRTSSGTD